MSILDAAEPSKQRGPSGVAGMIRRCNSSSLTLAWLLVGGTLALVAGTGRLGRLEPLVLFFLPAAAIVILLVSPRLRRPRRTWPWLVIAIALTLFLVSGAARTMLGTMGDLTEARSLVPDLMVLPAYALLAAGLLGFSRNDSGEPHRQWSILLDGLIAAMALGALAWVFVIQPVVLQLHAPDTVKLILTIYPPMSIFMVVVTLRIAFSPKQERVPAYWLLLSGMTFLFIGDVAYMYADVNLLAFPDSVLHLPYTLAYVFAAATALHPSMRLLTEPAQLTGLAVSRPRITLVAVALVVPAILTLRQGSGSTTDRIVLCLLMLAMTAAAVLRIVEALLAAARSEARLVHQAHHDSLTGLPNRRMMERHLTQLLEKPGIEDNHVAVLYLDIDRFKLINDTLGHSHGDALLIEVAQRLSSNVRSVDLVTRIGGDEFMIILGRVVSVSQALDLTNRLRECLKDPFVVAGMTFYVSASIGLAFASGDDPEATAEVLIRDADTAMYQAKDAGRDAVAVFDGSMRQRIAERVELEHDLHSALELHQLHLVYQPIIRLPSGTTIGMEALIRWTHPTHGVIPPAKFIPLAEESGMISRLGLWVIEEAVSQLAAWRRQFPEMTGLYVSVNLSGAQLHDSDIVERIADILAVNGLQGSALCLELTESVVMDDPAAAASILAELRELGIHIAIDDFGSEYSSLAYLKRFPATILKIDKSFVSSLDKPDNADATLIATIVAMGRALGITTVAEGVETVSQAQRLTELGCDAVQGFLYSRPVGADRLPEIVTSLGAQRLQLVRS